ncbi:MAG TPA: hypothetical protein VNT32_14460 [Thermoleophilaceae bacterium]|nr:hypothetical protein [Thermoleophilaceae bacterium]
MSSSPQSRAGRPPAGAGERGQATVEAVGALPALVLVGLALMQLLAVGYSKSLAAAAAEAGALAVAAGGDAERAARRAVPGWSRARMRVSESGGTVRIRMRPPAPIDAVARTLEVSESAHVEAP